MTTLHITVPEEVERKVARVVERQHISLEEFMAMALMEKLSTIPDRDLERRARRAKPEDFEAFLDLVPDVPPDDRDRLD